MAETRVERRLATCLPGGEHDYDRAGKRLAPAGRLAHAHYAAAPSPGPFRADSRAYPTKPASVVNAITHASGTAVPEPSTPASGEATAPSGPPPPA